MPSVIESMKFGLTSYFKQGAIKTINSSSCKSILVETSNKTNKQIKSILKKKFYLHNDSGNNKIYIKNN